MSSTGAKSRAAARLAARRTPESVGRRPVLTGRAALLVVVFALLVFTLAVPARQLFAQRAQIAALRDGNVATAAQIAQLKAEQARLADPAYVRALVRERLHYVMPGEVGYVVLGPDSAPATANAAAGGASTQPWYQQLWSSVQVADGAPLPSTSDRVVVPATAPR